MFDQHILSDRNCTSTVQSVKTLTTQLHGYDNDDKNSITEEFATLFGSLKLVPEKPKISPAPETPWRPLSETEHVHFGDTLYDVQE